MLLFIADIGVSKKRLLRADACLSFFREGSPVAAPHELFAFLGLDLTQIRRLRASTWCERGQNVTAVEALVTSLQWQTPILKKLSVGVEVVEWAFREVWFVLPEPPRSLPLATSPLIPPPSPPSLSLWWFLEISSIRSRIFCSACTMKFSFFPPPRTVRISWFRTGVKCLS